MILQNINTNSREWTRINMRNVNHLLGVEFIHNLYNRHLPSINSIRFRNTITIWNDGIVNSYAPKEEWDMLDKWLGEKFFLIDKTLIDEVEKLINVDRIFLFKFLKKINNIEFSKVSNVELAFHLLDLQDFVLGEIYIVNLVQIERALTFAILKILRKYKKNGEKRLVLLTELIVPKELTEFQKEELKFLKIVKIGKSKKIFDLNKSDYIKKIINEHFQKHSHIYCAYGEDPFSLKKYFEKYSKLVKIKNINGQKLKNDVAQNYKVAINKLKNINDKKLNKLIPLMSNLGVFRDKNKALLGKTIKFRLQILDEISKRKIESRNNLNYYLLSEVLNLLRFNAKIESKIINKRKKCGVELFRREGMEYFNDKNNCIVKSKVKTKKLKGMCASPGEVIGRARIVLTKEDGNKIKEGDIMVAIGTDFDLMQAIQLSSGVITEEGGLLSHASVVCRELRKPCCIGVINATSMIKDCQKIKLDASDGKIIIIK